MFQRCKGGELVRTLLLSPKIHPFHRVYLTLDLPFFLSCSYGRTALSVITSMQPITSPPFHCDSRFVVISSPRPPFTPLSHAVITYKSLGSAYLIILG